MSSFRSKASVALLATAVGALFSTASYALSVPIVPGGSVVLAADNDYTYSQQAPTTGTGTDTFNFVYAGGFASPALGDASVHIKLAPLQPYTSITLTWDEGASVLAGPVSFASSEQVVTLPLPDLTTGPSTLYHLIISWVKNAAYTSDRYDLTVSTGPAEVPNPTPLPAAGILFLSGLAGLGLLGRRRRASKQIAA